MLFNSLKFILLFLPAVLVVAARLRGQWLLGWICAASALFYGFAGHAWFLVPMAITTLLDYWIGQRLAAATSRRKFYLLLSLVGNLGLLAYFKYSGLLVEGAEAIAHAFGFATDSSLAASLRVVLPAGISFYTFQTMSYVIDIYRHDAEPEPNFLAYLAFVSFFPHLVAGPLTRHHQLLPQLHRIKRDGISPRWWTGVSLFSIGLAKKVLIADRIAEIIDPLIADVAHMPLAASWLALFGYALQIYFDFSGYSDMAIGLGRLFGIELPQNFNSPYKSLNPSDFWRRWHITLSQWLRDYLYISLGGNRRSAGRTHFNLFLTMLLGGLWHGANWTFAVWGAYHGAFLIAYRHLGSSWDRIPQVIQRGGTLVLVCIGWVFFRSPTLHTSAQWLAGMIGRHGMGMPHEHAARLAVLVCGAMTIALVARNAYQLDLDALTRTRRAALGLTTAAAIIMINVSSKFLYFQF